MTLRASIVSLCLTLLVAAAATAALQPPPGFVHGEEWPGTGTHLFTWPAPEGWITVLEEVDFGSNAAAPEFQGKWLYHYTVTNRITSPIDQWGFLDPLDGGPILAYGSSVLNTEWGFDDTGNIPVWTAGTPIPVDGAGSFWFISAGPPDRLDYRAFAKDGDLVVEGLTSGPTGENGENGYVTFTPGGWGSRNGAAARLLRGDNYFASIFGPDGLLIGLPPIPTALAATNANGAPWAALFTRWEAIRDWLPSGGTAGPLGRDFIDPSNRKKDADFLGNTLANHAVALTLNIEFSGAGLIPKTDGTGPAPPLGDAQLWQLDGDIGDFADVITVGSDATVAQALAIANLRLSGGSTPQSAGELAQLLSMINESNVP